MITVIHSHWGLGK